MRTIFVTAVSVSLMFASPTTAFAQSKEINPWQDCGLGAMVFPDNPTAAAISNVIWDLGTTAVTSKLASPESCEGERVKAAMIIQQSFAQVALETAVGRGEHLDAVADLFGCSAEVRPALVADMRSALGKALAEPAFATSDTPAKAERYFTDLESTISSSYATSCSVA